MIPAIVLTTVEGWLGPKFAKLATPLIYAVVIGLIVLGIVLAFRFHDHKVVTGYVAKQQQRAAPANDRAAQERANDTTKIATQEQEAHNVIHSVPDAAPAGPSHQLACERLRRLGRSVPACGGPQSGH